MKKPTILNKFQKKTLLSKLSCDYDILNIVLHTDDYEQAFYTFFFKINDIVFCQRVVYNTSMYHPETPQFSDFLKEVEFCLSKKKNQINEYIFEEIVIREDLIEAKAHYIYKFATDQCHDFSLCGIFGSENNFILAGGIYEECLNMLNEGKSTLEVLQKQLKALNLNSKATIEKVIEQTNLLEEE